ncbi:hypothetical protein [Flavobacterium reichenbachii]|uniref:Uncharacterized protein n=1 Tax=Flavobacterium reichenbachii TaxID=362418 RepID=A0A085ZNW5_9FLAO|nr:hypothetical protein [Flavobacterium reichenbachii]KFF06129.1 hypothetical protein IW19_11575 [Flavobacterium reichenbachii]OXB17647.1 hypothetical protein B0A68_04990 [Flavobacterium reichenbachii]
MTKKVKNTIALGFPIVMFITTALLFYITSLKSQKSYIELAGPNSKIALEKEYYKIYSLSAEGDPKKSFTIKADENKLPDTLKISISRKTEHRWIRSSQTTILDGKKYEYLNTLTVPKKGLYTVLIYDSESTKARLVIQNQNDDDYFFKSIVIYYLLSILSIVLLVIVLLFLLVKTIINRKSKI